MAEELTTGVKSHTANGLFMCREVGHYTIAIRVLTNKHLHKTKEG